jgi:beta-glucanase (GH16 family)
MIGTQIGKSIVKQGLSDNFHVYKLDWSPSRLVISIDNLDYFTYDKESNAGYDSWPFDEYFNIILNTAVGGWWGAAQGIDDSVYPQQYQIDYVKYTAYKGSDANNSNTNNNNNGGGNNNIFWHWDVTTGFNWSQGCDWFGNDLTSVQAGGDRCASLCKSTTGCSHFSWNKYNGGTCWLKTGQVAVSSAIVNLDQSFVCGHSF